VLLITGDAGIHL